MRRVFSSSSFFSGGALVLPSSLPVSVILVVFFAGAVLRLGDSFKQRVEGLRHQRSNVIAHVMKAL